MSTSRTSLSILTFTRYVEKLLKDKEWLASGVQELYHRLQLLHGWTGPLPAKLVSGLPHVHSILDGLGVLTSDEDKKNVVSVLTSDEDKKNAVGVLTSDEDKKNAVGVLTSDKDKKNAADHEDTALFDLHFSTAPKAKENFHNLTFTSNALLPETSVSRDYKQPTDHDITPKQALNSYLVFPQPALLSTPLTNGSSSSVQYVNQGKMHQDGDQDFFSLQGWDVDLTQAIFPVQIHTEEYTPFPHTPWSNLPTTCVQTPTEDYDIRVQQSALDPEQSPTIQLGQQIDYFSLGMEYPAEVSSAIEFFADFDKVLEERLLY
jgi:hypothetical protein